MYTSHATLESVALVTKVNDRVSLQAAEQIKEWLENKNVRVNRFISGPDEDKAFHNVDLVLTVGGDGTMISVARKLVGSNTPLAGVNLGRVGFLPELEKDGWKKPLLEAIEHGVITEKRMALSCTVIRDGKAVYNAVAVNDVVLARGGLARLLAMDVAVDSETLLYLRADGFIISTPTGSTAYSSSAGGPLLHPALNVYSVTAICPFMTYPTPLVLGADAELSALVLETSAKTFITVDGQELFKMNTGDTLKVKGIPGGILFASFGISHYYDKLRSSGIIKDSPGGPR